jgi:hypothetical protein
MLYWKSRGLVDERHLPVVLNEKEMAQVLKNRKDIISQRRGGAKNDENEIE